MEDKTCEKREYIEGYEGTHQVSDKGIVYYWNKNTKKWISKCQKKINGYCYVILPKRKKKLVHRLVAKAFIDNPKNKETVDHIDGVKDNNCVENLRWLTQKENNQAYEASKNKKMK